MTVAREIFPEVIQPIDQAAEEMAQRPNLSLVPDVRLEAPATGVEAIKLEAESELRAATARFMIAVETVEAVEPANRETTIMLADKNPEDFAIGDWKPASVQEYSSEDPYQQANPLLTEATTKWIENTINVTRRLRDVAQEQGEQHDPELAYLESSSKRASGGRKMTLATRIIAESDPGIGDWLKHLPSAERLRPVAHPWLDGTTIVHAGMEVTDGQEIDRFEEIESTPALQALTGGSGDGRAVREREAWERMLLPQVVKPELLTDSTLKITSLGTGTGEPTMDTGLAVMKELYGENGAGKVQVTGVDVNPVSLKVATHMAELKQQTLDDPEALTFSPLRTNLLSEEGIKEAVGDTDANVYEAIGFAEYVPSDYATDPAEQSQREFMRRVGMLSAEEFYGKIYEHMPKGSVFITGNMRKDSPQGEFVRDGLGWPQIIQRDTKEYLEILRKAGVPSEAVQLFVPDKDKSAAVYNLVAITKQ